ncbi:hypothetical protein EMCRGX_G021245 [Ephydatia muelleri]
MELKVTGAKGIQSSLVYSFPPCPTQHVVFFQGDTQNLRANMETQYEDVSRWKNWCLENTCVWLQKKFPTAAIWIVRPCRMLRNLFSCFHQFVNSSITGVPDYDSTFGAIPHLRLLLKDAIRQVCQERRLDDRDVEHLPITLVGFSKGCVVLNQIVHELSNYVDKVHRAAELEEFASRMEKISLFVKRFKAFYWLDSGHSGDHGAWITDDRLLKTLAALKADIYVHVTPYQVCCAQRPWIGEEEKMFVEKLRSFGADVHETIHFEHDGRTLAKHFQVLEVF